MNFTGAPRVEVNEFDYSEISRFGSSVHPAIIGHFRKGIPGFRYKIEESKELYALLGTIKDDVDTSTRTLSVADQLLYIGRSVLNQGLSAFAIKTSKNATTFHGVAALTLTGSTLGGFYGNASAVGTGKKTFTLNSVGSEATTNVLTASDVLYSRSMVEVDYSSITGKENFSDVLGTAITSPIKEVYTFAGVSGIQGTYQASATESLPVSLNTTGTTTISNELVRFVSINPGAKTSITVQASASVRDNIYKGISSSIVVDAITEAMVKKSLFRIFIEDESFDVSLMQNATSVNGKSAYIEDVINDVSKYVIVNHVEAKGTQTDNANDDVLLTLQGITEGVYQDIFDTLDILSAFDVDSSRASAIYCNTNIAYGVSQASQRALAKKLFALNVIDLGDLTKALSSSLSTSLDDDEGRYGEAVVGKLSLELASSGKRCNIPLALFRFIKEVSRISSKTPWQAVLGLSTGAISTYGIGTVVGAPFKPNEDDIGKLYDNNINTFKWIEGKGVFYWGQKTTYSKNSALDRANVRNNLNTIEYDVRGMLFKYLGSNITTELLKRIKDEVSRYLDEKKNLGAFYAFIVSTSRTTPSIIDQNGLVLDIFVSPTKALEYAELNVFVTRTGETQTIASQFGA